MKRIVQTEENCPQCGEPIVYWLPDDIDISDLSTKLRASTTIKMTPTNTHAPMHPGRYCENGCIGQLFNFGCDDLWERLEAERAARETASILVRPVSHEETPLL